MSLLASGGVSPLILVFTTKKGNGHEKHKEPQKVKSQLRKLRSQAELGNELLFSQFCLQLFNLLLGRFELLLGLLEFVIV